MARFKHVWKSITPSSVADLTTLGAVAGSAICFKVQEQLTSSELNQFPSYTGLVGTSVGISAAAVSFFSKKTFRRASRNEIFNFWTN